MIGLSPKTHKLWVILKDDLVEVLHAETTLKFRERKDRQEVNLFIDSEDELKRLQKGLNKIRRHFKKKARHTPHKERKARQAAIEARMSELESEKVLMDHERQEMRDLTKELSEHAKPEGR